MTPKKRCMYGMQRSSISHGGDEEVVRLGRNCRARRACVLKLKEWDQSRPPIDTGSTAAGIGADIPRAEEELLDKGRAGVRAPLRAVRAGG
eukprot:1731145-Pleurochrysis_carterae.AAC.1